MREPSTLAICIPTFKRPVLLKQCLLAIGQLDLTENLNILIIIIDNDSELEGKEVCDNVLRYKKTYSAFAAWIHFIPKTLGKFIGAVLSLICAGLLNIIHERYRY